MIKIRKRLNDREVQGAHPADSFAAILKQERARADRFETFFCLISLSLGSNAARIPWLQGFVKSVGQRLRTIDALGWIDRETLGVILPATDIEGARTVAKDIERIAISSGVALFYTVTRYPETSSPERAVGDRSDSTSTDRSSSLLISSLATRKLPEWKRFADIVGSFALIVAAAPLMILLSIYIKAVSRGPLLFKQQRIGRHGRPFTMLKFRTMEDGCSQEIHQQHIVARMRAGGNLEKMDSAGDARIIPGGKLLRKACIDELPQLINVLRGEMSIVGPRPCLPYEAHEYQRWHRERFDALPGLTGLWQISGKNKLTLTEMMRLDIAYSRSLTLWLDVKIALRTAPAILKYIGEAVINRLGTGTREQEASINVNPAPPRTTVAPEGQPALVMSSPAQPRTTLS
jgi:lipopolysaccharide/colanic/teichoic acid biosynthesis glycosyltransferase